MPDFNTEKPIFQQIAEKLEDAVLSGAFGEETQVPSTTEISVGYQINPATALKGMNLLVEKGILYKRRGLGMFVCAGAKEKIRTERRDQFCKSYVLPLVMEAKKLGFSPQQLSEMVERGYQNGD